MTDRTSEKPPTLDDLDNVRLESLTPEQSTLLFWNCHANYVRGNARGKVIGFILGATFAFTALGFFNWINS